MKLILATLIMALVFVALACQKKEATDTRTAADSSAVDARPGMLAVPPADSLALAPGPWHWIGTQTAVEWMACPDPSRYKIEFVPDSLVTAQIDCNRGSGPYHLDGKSIHIGPLATTRMGCPEGSLDSKFAQQLDAARIWFMHGDTLMFDLFADSGTMRFVR